MYTGPLTISNMFVATTGIAPAPPKPNAVKKAVQFSPCPDDNPPPANTPEATKTDNTFAVAQGEPKNKPPEEFHHTLRNKTMAEQPNTVQSWLEQYSQTVENDKEVITTKIQPKAGYELAQLLANFKTTNSTPVTGRAAKSAEIKLLLTTGDKGQLGLKTVLPETSKGPPATNSQADEGKNANKILIPNDTVVPTKTSDNGENTKELIREALLDNHSKATTTGEKTAAPNKSSIFDTQETPPSNASFLLVQDKLSKLQFQPAGIGPVKSTPTAEKPTDRKAPATEQSYILSESSNSNDKGQRGNLSGDSTFQKLNVTEVQISTGQTRGHGNSTSSNSSDSNLEQMLSHNNPQTPITEQLAASAEAPKTTNLPEQTSPSDASVSIGKQILESIHNSLSQQGENQQITVRLNPPELGKVFIKFQEQDAQITGLLEVSKTQTRYEIEQALPQIIRDLAGCGIQIKRLEVLLSAEEQSEQQAFKDQSLQDGWAQQQDSANPGGRTNNTPVNEWLINDNSYTGLDKLQEMFVGEHSINILI